MRLADVQASPILRSRLAQKILKRFDNRCASLHNAVSQVPQLSSLSSTRRLLFA
jgi:hypothetical protein